MACQSIVDINEIPRKKWNALISDASPFTRHEFLAALESSGCVTAEKGWLPHHIIYTKGDELIAAMPFYIKGHSYGEYIFDWAWADAYHRHGIEYYPKGLCAIPYTPVSANKILISDSHDKFVEESRLTQHAVKTAKELKLSSIHGLFLNQHELQVWQEQGFSPRSSYQFHWRNNGYQNFDDYLKSFTSVKRKKIRQQRKSVSQTDIELKIIQGESITEQNWHDFYRFYKNTVHLHGAMAYLNLDFFLAIGNTMPDQTMMISAFENKKNIASALFFKNKKTLFGRYWGCDIEVNNLHFETCYYQAINYCIENNIQYFEAGAQGEHKLSRGLLPVEIKSAHWLRHPQFFDAIKDHIDYETDHVQRYIEALEQHTPFKNC